jgi:lambda family phage portal protein
MKKTILTEEQRLRATAQRIRARWHQPLRPKAAQITTLDSGVSTYGGSDVTNTTADFLGDWRSADGWHRFDLFRVRARSRQLERGNPWCKSFKNSAIANILGHKGFVQKNVVMRSTAYGDSADNVPDKIANELIKAARERFEKQENFTSRKNLSRRDVDRLLLCRLMFDGEIIMRKLKKFDNEFGFTWQLINPDYLDHTLNRTNGDNGNIIKMGVELDKDYKFPVAYWFLRRRPNDYWFDYRQYDHSLYYRVSADEIMHVFLQTEDQEQTRGWPWLFAAAVNLFRLNKYEEAALVNATIGASKMGFFKKTVPDGFIGDPKELDDDGSVIDEVAPGTWQELPWNVDVVPWSPTYPDAEFEIFEKAMLRSIASVAGCSYASLSGDLSDTSFSSSRVGQDAEHEYWMIIQEFLIEKLKKPEYEEFLYRAILGRHILLPISKFDKFNKVTFRGRRWNYVNPIQDMQAKQLALDMCTTSITAIIEDQGGDRDEVFQQIAQDKKDMETLEIARVHSAFQLVDYEAETEPTVTPKKEPVKKPADKVQK